MPLLFIALSIILIVAISFGLKYHDEYMVMFYVQEGVFGLLLLIYLSLIVESNKMKMGNYEAILKNGTHNTNNTTLDENTNDHHKLSISNSSRSNKTNKSNRSSHKINSS
jgi:hypothetical protein